VKRLLKDPAAVAHVRQDAEGTWKTHGLLEHLRGVAEKAAVFADRFGAGAVAGVAGWLHDLGKFRVGFQGRIRRASGYDPDAHIEGGPGRISHSTAGALLACEQYGVAGRLLAYLIAGHHAGLYDWHGGLKERLAGEDARHELADVKAARPPTELLEPDGLDLSSALRNLPGGKDGFALWVRMLFSCVVDADFLDTEAFMDEDKATARGDYPDIPTLLAAFDEYMAKKTATAPPTPLNRLRAEVLGNCRERAQDMPGLFSLTVPTGGGKTLSSLAFALEHARRHGKRRVIYAIPYTSIIEQTADVFREVFRDLDPDPVVEHHSQADLDDSRETLKARLACENWDAPLVVTTNVQLFESLFAAKTSRCRKLHNLVDSVVILDEAQTLPPEFLQPILDVLNLLAKHYGVSVVLCTATQPALASKQYFDRGLRGLEGVREIIPDPDRLYSELKRVAVRLPADMRIPTDWPALAEELAGRETALCIVNRRQDARDLWHLMPTGTMHLSALMCGAHRAEAIRTIKARLEAKRRGEDGEPLRVVSTQLVEAGVDLDFPVVYRALAGLDSIAQAAGRCNREGRLKRGEVVVFIPPQPAPPGLLRKGEDACRSVLHGHRGDPLERSLFARYFEHLYHACDLDAKGICKDLRVDGELAVSFRTAADKFRLIEDGEDAQVFVHYRGPNGNDNAIDGLLGKLEKEGPERWLLRKLQRYAVSIKRRDLERLLAQGDLREVSPGLFIQASDILYHPKLGLMLDSETLSAASLVG
jgi:CRISPR-associated endonuclease/helicase Cas3